MVESSMLVKKPAEEQKPHEKAWFAADMQNTLGMLCNIDINDKRFSEASVKDWFAGKKNSITEMLRAKYGGMATDFNTFENALRQKLTEAYDKSRRGSEELNIFNLSHPRNGADPVYLNPMENVVVYIRAMNISTSDLGVDLKALAKSGIIHREKIDDAVKKVMVVEASAKGVKGFEDEFNVYKTTYDGGFSALKQFMESNGYGKVYVAAVADAEKFVGSLPPLPKVDPKLIVPVTMLAREDARQNMNAQRMEEQAIYVAKLNEEFLSKLDEERAKRSGRSKQESG